MPDWQYFSDTAGLHRPTDGLMLGNLPTPARNSIRASVLSMTDPDSSRHLSPQALMTLIVTELGADPDLIDSNVYTARRNVDYWLEATTWWEVLDAITLIFKFAELTGEDVAGPGRIPAHVSFRATVRRALRRFHSAYVMDEDGQIRPGGTSQSETAVTETRALLAGPEFSGPERQFGNALEALSRRPEPNYEGVVSGSVNALEGVIRTVLDDSSIVLGAGVNRIKREKGLHSALAESIKRIYGYASDSGGRHGLTGEPDVDAGIAEFCLHQSAAAMVFIARLYGYEQQVVTV